MNSNVLLDILETLLRIDNTEITIVTNDKRKFIITYKVGRYSSLIGRLARIENGRVKVMEISLPNVTGKMFEKALEWCEHHQGM